MLDKLSSLSPWVPIGCICLTAALFNLITSLAVLLEESRTLVFFRPLKSFGFWIWAVLQMVFPWLGFWIMFSVTEKTQVNLGEFFKAAFFGIGFFTFVNHAPPIGLVNLDFKVIYASVLKIPIEMIRQKEANPSADFWGFFHRELKEKITQDVANVDMGIDYLADYASISTQSFRKSLLSSEAVGAVSLVNDLKIIDKARKAQDVDRKASLVETSIKKFIRRKDLYSALEKVGCVQSAERIKARR
jgi:hypothetical protein